MSRDLQTAIDFLVRLDLTNAQRRVLPHVPDYQALADQARDKGFTLTPIALQEAFRLLMQARIVGTRGPA